MKFYLKILGVTLLACIVFSVFVMASFGITFTTTLVADSLAVLPLLPFAIALIIWVCAPAEWRRR